MLYWVGRHDSRLKWVNLVVVWVRFTGFHHCAGWNTSKVHKMLCNVSFVLQCIFMQCKTGMLWKLVQVDYCGHLGYCRRDASEGELLQSGEIILILSHLKWQTDRIMYTKPSGVSRQTDMMVWYLLLYNYLLLSPLCQIFGRCPMFTLQYSLLWVKDNY